ncbi:hypothetical protein DFS33DRAFT_1454519 [Desarmillaria ectypa]|nr:hypothetical protein DFS33DRAFT_1454519 [Desarmillaria ectypa]
MVMIQSEAGKNDIHPSPAEFEPPCYFLAPFIAFKSSLMTIIPMHVDPSGLIIRYVTIERVWCGGGTDCVSVAGSGGFYLWQKFAAFLRPLFAVGIGATFFELPEYRELDDFRPLLLDMMSEDPLVRPDMAEAIRRLNQLMSSNDKLWLRGRIWRIERIATWSFKIGDTTMSMQESLLYLGLWIGLVSHDVVFGEGNIIRHRVLWCIRTSSYYKALSLLKLLHYECLENLDSITNKQSTHLLLLTDLLLKSIISRGFNA